MSDPDNPPSASPPPPPPPPPPPSSGFPPPPPPGASAFGTPPPGYTPYQGPTGGGLPTAGGERAGFWIRFVAALLDGLVIGIPLGVVLAVLGIDAQGAGTLIQLVVGGVYFVYFESTTGQTLGKSVCNIKVVDQNTGAIIDQGRAITRYLISIVSGLVCALGYLWMLWDSDRQTWHDKGSHTYVVKV